MSKIQQKTYTEEQTEELVNLYNQLGSEKLEEISEKTGKSVKSIRSKLVRLGVYKPIEKVSTKKSTSKKEMLLVLEKKLGFDTTGFSGSTKEVLDKLIKFLDN